MPILPPQTGGGGAPSVRDEYRFTDTAARDAYFVSNPSKLRDKLYVITDGTLQEYDSTEGQFNNISQIYEGPKGDSAPVVLFQYSADGSTSWSNTLNTTIHKYWRWSTDNGVTWSPDGIRYSAVSSSTGVPDPYRYEVGANGKLQLFKDTQMIAEQDDDGTWLADSVKTGTGSIHIGELFSAGSAGRHIVWVNHDNNTAYHAAASGVSLDGTTKTPLSTSIVGDVTFDYPNGSNYSIGSIDYNYVFNAPINAVFFGLNLIAGEEFTGRLRWKVEDVNNGLEIASFYTSVAVLDGGNLSISFKYPLWSQAGKSYRLTLTKDDGSYFKVRVGDDGTTPFRMNEIAPYTDYPVFHEGDPVSVAASLNTLTGADRISGAAIKNLPVASSDTAGVVKVGPTLSMDGSGVLNTNVTAAEKRAVAGQSAMLALPQISNLYIVTRTDLNQIYYLNANDDPSVLANWEAGPSTADTVASFNGRIGDVTPQAGDYTLDMVATTDTTANKDYKLVIDNGVLYMEEV